MDLREMQICEIQEFHYADRSKFEILLLRHPQDDVEKFNCDIRTHKGHCRQSSPGDQTVIVSKEYA